jgi:hypothetical protein
MGLSLGLAIATIGFVFFGVMFRDLHGKWKRLDAEIRMSRSAARVEEAGVQRDFASMAIEPPRNA